MARNPLRSEAEAFRFVLLTVAYFALIVVAAAIDRWLGVAVFVLLTGLALWRWFRAVEAVPHERTSIPHRGAEDERRILVIANETLGGTELFEVLRSKAEGVREQVLVVTPALNSPLRHWASDEDGARVDAQERLDASLARLAREGIEARGEVGDGDPLQAIEDALRTFGADEIVISTHPEGRSNWLERNVVGEAGARFDVPITHVVVDLEATA
ncbi:MAG: universal stress protein [Gaiellaceae bacterium MAG52_C11]|nr:universal stress protein [Candidatus Gaiellasilicea maunaloa]